MVKHAGALIRVSTVGQLNNTSTDTQQTEIAAACAEHGFSLDVDHHVWMVAESGKKKSGDRLGLERARRAVLNHEIERLYVYNVKRLSRNMTTGLQFIEEMNLNGCEIYNIATNKVLSRYDLSFIIELMLAEKDGNDIVEETYKGLKRVVNDGVYSGGIVAYGYKLNPETKKLEIDEKEAEVVRLIYRLCITEQMSCKKIADYLNAQSIPTKFSLMPQPRKGKRRVTKGIWRYGRIRNMIVNTAYKGEWVWGKRSVRKDRELIKSKCPVIVDEKDWNAAQEVLKRNRLFDPTVSTKHHYLLRGLIKCKYCNHNFCGYCSRLYNGTVRRYYKCNGRTQLVRMNEPPCDSPTLNAEKVEEYVWNKVLNYCRRPETILSNLRERKDEFRDAEIGNEISKIEKLMIEIDNQKNNFLVMQSKLNNLDMGFIDSKLADLNKDLETLLRRKSRLLAELDSENKIQESIDDFDQWLKKMQSHFDNASWEDKREIIVYLVDKIEASYKEENGEMHPFVEVFFKFQKPEETGPDSAILNLTGRDSWRPPA